MARPRYPNHRYATGLLPTLLRRQAEARRHSPHGRAGVIGGKVAALTYPNARRPRDANGRFLPEGKEGRTPRRPRAGRKGVTRGTLTCAGCNGPVTVTNRRVSCPTCHGGNP